MARVWAAVKVRVARPASRISEAGPVMMRAMVASQQIRRAQSLLLVAP
jgi:hypothetical protein